VAVAPSAVYEILRTAALTQRRAGTAGPGGGSCARAEGILAADFCMLTQ
jgi:hypothetical protein